ncbi:GNAT family N-acetyltransferase [Pacificispira sp.]|uniref:GNAT family N-acetyltransferase n=1 Tax=Pacificispira sp. TaxID=2888761 RepID=UPI003BADA074
MAELSDCKTSEVVPFSAEASVAAKWLNVGFGADMGYSLSETEDWCNHLAQAESETLMISKIGHRIVGTVVVCECDLEGYEHLTPWLSSLFVPEADRGNGIGALLAREATDWASGQNHADLYLYAKMGRLIPYYKSLGWHIMEDIQVHGEAFQIMRKSLAPNSRDEFS